MVLTSRPEPVMENAQITENHPSVSDDSKDLLEMSDNKSFFLAAAIESELVFWSSFKTGKEGNLLVLSNAEELTFIFVVRNTQKLWLTIKKLND